MLIRFGVSNHRSIRKYQELVFTATSLKDSEVGLIPVLSSLSAESSQTSPKSTLRLVPVVAIYGANAAGKSTVLNAFDFFVNGIAWSHDRTASKKGTPYNPFLLDSDSRKIPSIYDADIVIGDTRYHYGYAIDGESIVSEWLYSFSLSSSRQTKTVLFHRSKKEDKQFYFGKTLKGDNKRIANLVRPNSLFLSAAAQNSHPHLQPIYDFFCDKITRRIDETSNILLGSVSEQLTAYFKDDDVRRKKALSFVRAADIGIADFDFSKQPIGEKQKNILHDFELLLAKHIQDPDLSKVFDGKDEKVKVELLHLGESDKNFPIPLKDESSGTLSLLQLLGPIFSRLSDGGVLIVDELNITLHPLVSRELIKLFSSPKTNPGKAQLVFTTHDTSMLVSGLLRRDQIWFAEKDRFGATSIYSLSSIKVRSSDNLEKGYITGRFGAVPLFGIRSSDFKRIGIASDLDEGAI